MILISALQYKKVTIAFSEDTLTSCIFDTLFLLPEHLFWKILNAAVFKDNKDDLPEEAGKRELYEFWPKWDPTNTGNSHHVEPDLFMRFSGFDVIIEAKRYENGQQDRNQWEKEIRAYFNVYGNENKKLYFIALGGLHTNEPETVEIKDNGKDKKVSVVKCLWSHILEKSIQILESDNTEVTSAIKKLLLSYFELYGYVQIQWMQDIKKNQSYDKSIRFLLADSERLSRYIPIMNFTMQEKLLKNYDKSTAILSAIHYV